MKQELVELKHKQSAKTFPNLSLHQDEYVVLAMERAAIGVTAIWVMTAACIILLSVMVVFFANNASQASALFNLNESAKHYLWMGVIAFYALIVFVGFVGQSVYKSNRMYVTNKRVIQNIRTSLFSNSTQVIELAKIEDVSFRQNNIIDHIFHIGILRMSTVGDETTYTFPLLETPHDEVETISKLVYDAHKPKHTAVAPPPTNQQN